MQEDDSSWEGEQRPSSQPGCPGARGTTGMQPEHGTEGKSLPAASITFHSLWLSLIKIDTLLCAVPAAGSWALGLSFSADCVASILASSCSREVLLMETPAHCCACPSQPLGSAGSWCPPCVPVPQGFFLPTEPMALSWSLNLSRLKTGSPCITAGDQLGPLPSR